MILTSKVLAFKGRINIFYINNYLMEIRFCINNFALVKKLIIHQLNRL